MKISEYPAAEHLLNQALNMDVLLPDCYATYRSAIRDALINFLERLPVSRQLEIFISQQSMAATSTSFDRFTALLRHCPTLHKLGQIMARNEDLSPELRLQLQTLESLPPSSTLEELSPYIERETKGEITPDGPPLAEASVAVVLPFTTPSGEKGVIKILKPGIKERLAEELEIWPHIGSFLEERCDYYGIPSIDYRDTLTSLQTILLNETDLAMEQKHLALMKHFYADSPDIVIPSLFPWSTSRFTAMTRIDGRKITESKIRGEKFNRSLGSIVVQSLLSKPFWSEGEMALFHGDPHSGNIFLTCDDKVALLDWSLVVNIGKERRQTVMQILLAACMLSRQRITEGLLSLSRSTPDRHRLMEVADESLAEIRKGAFPSFQWLVTLLDRAIVKASLSPADDMVLFRKVILTLLSVVRDVSQEVSADDILTASALANLLREAPERLFNLYSSETGRIHLKTGDLIEAFTTWPLTAMRYWCGAVRDISR